MSSLVASSKCVEVQSNNFAILTIKNAKTNANAETFPILFKIKTNLKELVDVRPSFGVLWSHSQKSTVALNVRYSGTQQQIDKAKLMISWFSTEDKKQFENRKFNHEQFNAFFNSARKVTEGSLLLPIVFKENAERLRNQLNKSEQAQSRLSEEPASVDAEMQRPQHSQQKEIEPKQENQIRFQSLSSELSSKGSQISEQKVKQGYSLKFIGLVIIIAFILGVSVGIKIERYVQPYINQFSLNIRESLQNFSISQSEQITQNVKQALQSVNASQKKEQPVQQIESQAPPTFTNLEPENFSQQIEIIDN